MTEVGLARGTVKLVPHQNQWHELFSEEADRIKSVLGEVDIEHVGSTAIPGLLAKPVIDMAIRYSEKEIAGGWVMPLEKLGYEHKGEEGVANRYFFVKGPAVQRSFYLHVVDPTEFKRLIDFRDRLLSSSDLAKKYSDLKAGLAKNYASNREAYTRGKNDFIATVLGGK